MCRSCDLSPSVPVIFDPPVVRVSSRVPAMIPPRAVVAVIPVMAPPHGIVPPRGIVAVSPVIARPIWTDLHPIPPGSRTCSGLRGRRPAQYSTTERYRRQSKFKVRPRLRCEHLLLLRQHHFKQHAARLLRSTGSTTANARNARMSLRACLCAELSGCSRDDEPAAAAFAGAGTVAAPRGQPGGMVAPAIRFGIAPIRAI